MFSILAAFTLQARWRAVGSPAARIPEFRYTQHSLLLVSRFFPFGKTNLKWEMIIHIYFLVSKPRKSFSVLSAKSYYLRPSHENESFSPNAVKGQCHDIFDFWFLWISFPQAPEHTIRAVSNFFKNSRRYLQLKVQIKKIFNQKSFNYFFGTPLCSRITYR